jgi:hypothetical protein
MTTSQQQLEQAKAYAQLIGQQQSMIKQEELVGKGLGGEVSGVSFDEASAQARQKQLMDQYFAEQPRAAAEFHPEEQQRLDTAIGMLSSSGAISPEAAQQMSQTNILADSYHRELSPDEKKVLAMFGKVQQVVTTPGEMDAANYGQWRVAPETRYGVRAASPAEAQQSLAGVFGATGSGAAQGAVTGGTLGTMVEPGLGTEAGALLGGIVGGAYGFGSSVGGLFKGAAPSPDPSYGINELSKRNLQRYEAISNLYNQLTGGSRARPQDIWKVS